MMTIQQHIKISRSQLLAMARLSQRAVDYSIKAYELGSPEFCRQVRMNDHELRELQRSIADRGRRLLTAGRPVDSDSRLARSASRICKALHITYIAATGIAHNTLLALEGGRVTVSPSPATKQMGQFVNSLVRLYTLALFKEEIQHSKTVLQNYEGRQWFNRAANYGPHDVIQRTGAQAGFEQAIANGLRQIAEQAQEIADAIAFWLEEKDRIGVPHDRAAYFLRESIPCERASRRKAAESPSRGFGSGLGTDSSYEALSGHPYTCVGI